LRGSFLRGSFLRGSFLRFVFARFVFARFVLARFVLARFVLARFVLARVVHARVVHARVVHARVVHARVVHAQVVHAWVGEWLCQVVQGGLRGWRKGRKFPFLLIFLGKLRVAEPEVNGSGAWIAQKSDVETGRKGRKFPFLLIYLLFICPILQAPPRGKRAPAISQLLRSINNARFGWGSGAQNPNRGIEGFLWAPRGSGGVCGSGGGRGRPICVVVGCYGA
jgi:hypothetical protein